MSVWMCVQVALGCLCVWGGGWGGGGGGVGVVSVCPSVC